MPPEVALSTTALIIALIALFITIAQLLQHLFATAEGYRRCQASVLGPWAKRTRKKFRWSQFRYEVFFTTPRIDFATVSRRELIFSKNLGSLFPPEITESTTDTEELASWISLLVYLYLSTSAFTERLSSEKPCGHCEAASVLRLPSIRYIERSWDFMPADVSRPMALTTIHDICVISVRLGMVWKDVRPSEGVMIAEGKGLTLTSSLVRSVGLVATLTSEGQQNLRSSSWSQIFPGNRLVPTANADELAFGMITADFRSTPLSFGSNEEIISTLNEMDPSGVLIKSVLEYQQREGNRIPGISDFICMTCTPLRLHSSTTIRIPRPTRDARGPINSVCGTMAFYKCLKGFVSRHGKAATDQSIHILHTMSRLSENFPQWTQKRHQNSLHTLTLGYLDAIHAILDLERLWLEDFRKQSSNNDDLYHTVLIEHIDLAVRCARKIRENGRRLACPYAFEMQEFFEDDFAELCKPFSELQWATKSMIIDLWLTLVFRGICWSRLHWMPLNTPFSTVPGRYFGSQLPIYIG